MPTPADHAIMIFAPGAEVVQECLSLQIHRSLEPQGSIGVKNNALNFVLSDFEITFWDDAMLTLFVSEEFKNHEQQSQTCNAHLKDKSGSTIILAGRLAPARCGSRSFFIIFYIFS